LNQELVGAMKDSGKKLHSSTLKPRRFIAGAVCPRCGVMDRIVTFSDLSGQAHKECVDCGFHEGLELEVPEELTTRVSRPAMTDPDTQPIRLMLGTAEENTQD